MTTTTQGGRRPGAGRPKKSAQQDSIASFHAARCRKENALADLRRMEADQLAGSLYDRGEVLRVVATTVAVFAEQMRSLPDKLERQAGITPEQAEIAEDEVNTQLDALRRRLVQGLASGISQDALIGALRDMLAELQGGAA